MFGITGTGFNVAKRLTNDGKVGRLVVPLRSIIEVADAVCLALASSIQLGSLGSDDDVSRRADYGIMERSDGEPSRMILLVHRV